MDPFEKLSENFQRSWDTHMQFFGPILASAFKDNFEARMRLTAALNDINQRKFQKAFTILAALKDMCSCDEDCAAWFFCMALAFEYSGMRNEMYRYYRECIKYEPDFSLPYLMVAKCAHFEKNLEYAAENYSKAVKYIENENLPVQTSAVRASLYTNYFSCLTSLGRFPEAEAALKKSEEILPEYTERLHYAAILYTCMGNQEKYSEYMQKLKNSDVNLYEKTKALINSLPESPQN